MNKKLIDVYFDVINDSTLRNVWNKMNDEEKTKAVTELIATPFSYMKLTKGKEKTSAYIHSCGSEFLDCLNLSEDAIRRLVEEDASSIKISTARYDNFYNV